MTLPSGCVGIAPEYVWPSAPSASGTSAAVPPRTFHDSVAEETAGGGQGLELGVLTLIAMLKPSRVGGLRPSAEIGSLRPWSPNAALISHWFGVPSDRSPLSSSET